MKTPVAQAASAQETLEDLLNFRRQRRTTAPIRRSFLQHPTLRDTPGPLHKFVAERRGLALDLYLLLHCGASGAPWDVELPAMAWARALDLPQTVSSETTISKNWTWLEKQKLITSEKSNRLRKVYLLREDGSGEEYQRAKKGEDHGFFRLPYAFFFDRWHQKLSLRARATLLICLAQNNEFELRTEWATNRYGLSPDSMQRGLDELRKHELLVTWPDYRRAPRARLGFTQVSLHRLIGPFTKPEPKTTPSSTKPRRKTTAGATRKKQSAAKSDQKASPRKVTRKRRSPSSE